MMKQSPLKKISQEKEKRRHLAEENTVACVIWLLILVTRIQGMQGPEGSSPSLSTSNSPASSGLEAARTRHVVVGDIGWWRWCFRADGVVAFTHVKGICRRLPVGLEVP
jgi:hypothetical protein